jgi:hypothetical protein
MIDLDAHSKRNFHHSDEEAGFGLLATFQVHRTQKRHVTPEKDTKLRLRAVISEDQWSDILPGQRP